MVTSGEREGEEGQYKDREERVIIGFYEIMCVKLLKIVKHYRIQRIIQLIKEGGGRGRGKEHEGQCILIPPNTQS